MVPKSRGRVSARPPVRRPASRARTVAALFIGTAVLLVIGVLAVSLGGSPRKAPVAPVPPVPPVPPAAPVARPVEREAPAAPRTEPVAKPAPEPPKPAPPVPKPPAPDPPPSASDEAEFRARLAERRRKGQERLETVRRELAEEDKAASQAAEALRKRLSSRPVTLSALEGRTYPKATIRRYTLYDAEIEAGGKVESISWDALTPDSIAAAAAALFDPGSAADQFERGRYFIARRRWKEAREAFEQAAKLDPGLDPRVAEFRDTLERLITGQGPFQGSARRAGADGLLLRYDFREAKQLEDFTPGLAHEAGRAVLDSAAAKEGVVLKGDSDIPVVFISELSLEGRFTAEGPVVLGLFDGPKRGYELEIGPEGTALSRLDAAAPDRRKPVGRSAQAKLTPGKTHHLRVFVKNWRFTVSIDRKEPAAFEDPPPPGPADILEGVLRIATAKGKLRIEAPLLVQGRLEAAELEKRVGETEVMVRRALDPDLEEVRVRREYRMALGMLSTGENLVLSADDRRFSWRIKTNEDLVVYEGLKKGLVSYLNGSPTVGFSLAAWEADVSKLIGRYPDVPALHYLRSVARAESQDGAAAREDLRKALELFPEFHEALTLQSRQHLSEGDLQGALSAANRALDLMPDSAEARVARALATFSRSPAAEDSFTEDLKIARRLDPHGSEAGTWLRVLVRQVRGPRDLGCRFEHETANYRISTDISPEAARRYGEALEAARRHFLETFRHLATPAPGRKPRVAIFNTAENYYTYNEILSETRAEHTGGVFRSTLNELVLFELLDETETLHTLFHEAFHHFMHQILLDTPPYWFNEGLADYMGALAVQGGKVVRKGLVVPDRQFAARLLLELNRTFPFEKLMLDTPRDFYGPDSWLKYAQAWSMVHFFYEAGGGKHRGLIEDYFKALRARKSPREAYDAVFAPRVSALEAEWKQHVRAVK